VRSRRSGIFLAARAGCGGRRRGGIGRAGNSHRVRCGCRTILPGWPGRGWRSPS